MIRSCDSCTSCCYNTRVLELNKPERVLCINCKDSACAIYENRPESCRSFSCAWLQGEMFDIQKPNLSGMMVENFGSFRFVMCGGDEWRNHLQALGVYIKKGIPVVIVTETNKTILAPEGISQNDVVSMIREKLNDYCN